MKRICQKQASDRAALALLETAGFRPVLYKVVFGGTLLKLEGMAALSACCPLKLDPSPWICFWGHPVRASNSSPKNQDLVVPGLRGSEGCFDNLRARLKLRQLRQDQILVGCQGPGID